MVGEEKIYWRRNSKAPEEETYEFLIKILNKIDFVNEENISTGKFIATYRLCKDIDEKAPPFVALSLKLGYEIWTRDDELKNGLRSKGFNHFYGE